MLVIVMSVTMIGCATNSNSEMTSDISSQTEIPMKQPEEKTDINIGVLKGPTGIGTVKLMEDNAQGKSCNQYHFTVASGADELTSKLISGEVDVAAVPTNLAAVLYQKTEGDIKLAAINTLGVLYLLENGEEGVGSIVDLEGKKIYASGQGSVPEYVLDYILKENGVEAQVEYKQDHAELAAALASGNIEIGMLPEPNVTSVMMKNDKVQIALDMTEEWDKVNKKMGNGESKLAMGCIVVSDRFLKDNQEAFQQFLAEYKESIDFTTHLSETAKLVEKYEIMQNATAAEKAIPNCNIVYIDGEEMKETIQSFYQVLFEANPKSVGGKLPDDSFYYIK